MKFSRVLVTGGAGFIGSHIVDALIGRDLEVGVLDDFATGEMSNLPIDSPRLRIHRGDIRDEAFVKQAVKGYDAIVHGRTTRRCAAGLCSGFRLPASRSGRRHLSAKRCSGWPTATTRTRRTRGTELVRWKMLPPRFRHQERR